MQKLIFFLLSLLLVGCSKKEDTSTRFSKEQIASLEINSTREINVNTDSIEHVNLNGFLTKQSFDFGSMVKEVKLLTLESTDESMLDEIVKIIVTDSNIYIYDDYKGGSIVIFNKEGRFVKRIPYGQGPGEIYRLYDIDFDEKQNVLIAYQQSYLMFFSPSGEFIKQDRLPLGFYNFLTLPDGYLFKKLGRQGNGHLKSYQDHSLLFTNKKFKIIGAGMKCLPNIVNYSGYNYLYRNNDQIHITQTFCDTIFQFDAIRNRLFAKYILDYQKKKLPEQYLTGSLDEFKNAKKHHDYYYYLGQFLDTDSHNVFFLENDYIFAQTVIFRDKKTGHLKGGTTANFSLFEMPPIAFPTAAYKDFFISLYDPSNENPFMKNSTIITNKNEVDLSDMNEDDNPVLIFFKLKRF